MGKEALVAFFCMKPEHGVAHNGGVSDHLTISEGAWAYCARDARLEDHAWEPTGGLSLSEVERFSRSRDARDARQPTSDLDVATPREAHR